MRINSFEADIQPEDIRILALPDNPALRMTPDEVSVLDNTPIVIKYDYIDLGVTPYNFSQEFKHEDTVAYFERMKKISSSTISILRDSGEKDLHFYRSPLKGNLRKAVRQIFTNPADDMILYHFALYTSHNGKACKESGTRSPRIYFMHGTNGFIYPLFFDPYHELNPM